MKKINFVLLSLIISSILILTNCSSNSKEIKNAEESEIVVTDEFLKFCDEFYNDKDYNPAKFKVEQEKFKDKWIVLSGKLTDIYEDGNIRINVNHYDFDPALNIKGITASYDFGSPEKVMNFKINQEIKIKAKYDYVASDIFNWTYIFYFKNPQVIE